MSHALQAQTPALSVVDSRGLLVCLIACHRTNELDRPALRVTLHTYSPARRLIASLDPRLPTPNQRSIYSLTGQVLLTDSVDSGWRLALLGEAGQLLEGWDGRDAHRQVEYDELLRPVLISQTATTACGTGFSREEARTIATDSSPDRSSSRLKPVPRSSQAQIVERFTYGGPESAERNQCNQLTRHDDTAGTIHHPDYGLLGSPLTEVRHFLRELDLPAWPLPIAERDALLEANGLESSWAFNAPGEVISQTDAMGNTRHFKQTVSGQLKSVALDEQVLLNDIHYNAFDQVEQQTAGNGVISRSLYDSQTGRLSELSSGLEAAPPLQHFKYSYDPVGNIEQIEDAAQPVRFFANQRVEPISRYRYDTLYQLIEATGREVSTGASHGPALPDVQIPPDPNQLSNYTQSYEYDAGGNLLEMHHVGAQPFTRLMRIAPDSNRSLPDEQVDVNFENGFDANGNLLQLVRGQDLSWDARNQLRHITTVQRNDAPSDSETYIYDGAGQRCRKISSAQASGKTLINEVRYMPGLEIRSNADGEILHVVTVNNVRLLHWPSGTHSDQLRYSLSDHLGSSTLELDQEGGLISQESYYPYGGTSWWAARSAVEAKYKTVRYSGKERDASGLYYYGYRYYAPWLQRWTSPDTSQENRDSNLYKMLENNPLNRIDKSGNVPIPTIAYYFWEGKNIPIRHLQNILMFKQLNPEYEVNLWTSRPSGTLTTLDEMLNNNHPAFRHLAHTHQDALEIRNPSELFENLAFDYEHTHKIESIFTRELNGPYKNLAASSDSFRLSTLYPKGGIYMDVDVAVTGPIGTLDAPHGFLAHFSDGLTSNAVMAAEPRSPIIKKTLDEIVRNYTNNPIMVDRTTGLNHGWTTKRSNGGEGLFSRLQLTMHMTGPGVIGSQLMGVNRNEYNVPVEFFAHREHGHSTVVPKERTISDIFFHGYKSGLNAKGQWRHVKPGRRASFS